MYTSDKSVCHSCCNIEDIVILVSDHDLVIYYHAWMYVHVHCLIDLNPLTPTCHFGTEMVH